MKKFWIILALLLISAICYSQKQLEKYYQNGFAIIMKGKTEVVLPDQARVDIVTDTFAIEVDFAHKWAESAGQAIYYSIELNKKAGVLLLVDGRKDERYIKRLMEVAERCNITVWLMDTNTDKWCKVLQFYEYSYVF
jgi:hypothetical protein